MAELQAASRAACIPRTLPASLASKARNASPRSALSRPAPSQQRSRQLEQGPAPNPLFLGLGGPPTETLPSFFPISTS